MDERHSLEVARSLRAAVMFQREVKELARVRKERNLDKEEHAGGDSAHGQGALCRYDLSCGLANIRSFDLPLKKRRAS